MANNQPPKRGRLSETFEKNLKTGTQSEILSYILADKELDVQLRDNYINVYYKGGNILEMHPQSYNFDTFYFYRRKDGSKPFPKSHVEKIAKGRPDKISKNTKEPIPSEVEALKIIDSLNEKVKALKALLYTDVKEYFDQAKEVMTEWFNDWDKAERNDQHTIAVNNRSFENGNNLVVVDIEFAVSRNHSYNHATNGKGETKSCRFDIVAVNRSGRIYVIELKQNKEADSDDNKANIKIHTQDFDNTVGRNDAQAFVDEIAFLVNAKKRIGVLDSSITINTSEKPIFAVAYSGVDANDFNEKYRKKGLTVVELEGEKKLLKLK
ncbi:MAG: hypothetical protein HDS92_02170 [Bacteroidales bacterium]|nr:hypothetical protein [Bacteroidales bacterium]